MRAAGAMFRKSLHRAGPVQPSNHAAKSYAEPIKMHKPGKLLSRPGSVQLSRDFSSMVQIRAMPCKRSYRFVRHPTVVEEVTGRWLAAGICQYHHRVTGGILRPGCAGGLGTRRLVRPEKGDGWAMRLLSRISILQLLGPVCTKDGGGLASGG